MEDILDAVEKYSRSLPDVRKVRGVLTEESDIDLLVGFKGRKTLLDLAGLKMEFEDAPRRKFDVLTYISINPLLRDRILEEQVAIQELGSWWGFSHQIIK